MRTLPPFPVPCSPPLPHSAYWNTGQEKEKLVQAGPGSILVIVKSAPASRAAKFIDPLLVNQLSLWILRSPILCTEVMQVLNPIQNLPYSLNIWQPLTICISLEMIVWCDTEVECNFWHHQKYLWNTFYVWGGLCMDSCLYLRNLPHS